MEWTACSASLWATSAAESSARDGRLARSACSDETLRLLKGERGERVRTVTGNQAQGGIGGHGGPGRPDTNEMLPDSW
jgi:hypothetical protein